MRHPLPAPAIRLSARLAWPHRLALVLGGFLLLAMAAALYHAYRLREGTLNTGRELAQSLARIGEHEVTINLRMIDRLLETRAAQWPATGAAAPAAFVEQLRADLSGVPVLRSVSIVAADGTIRASSIPQATGRQLDGAALAELRGPTEAPGARITRPWKGRDLFDGAPYAGTIDVRDTPYFFAVARRGGAGDDEVLLVAAINANFIADFQSTLTPSPDYPIELFRYDGILLVSTRPALRAPGFDGTALRVFSQLLPEREIGLLDVRDTSDAGIVAFRASRIYPVVTVVRLPYDALLAGWRNEMAQLAIAMTMTLAFVALLAGILYRHQLHRELTEDALRESETRFGSLTALSADWYWEQDTRYRFTSFSGGDPSAREGDGFGDAVGKARWELVGAIPLGTTWDAHRALLDARAPFRDFEYMRTFGDAGPRYIAVSGEPVFDRDGKFTGYRGTARDATERKRSQVLQTALYEISEAAHASADLQALFRRIHEIIGQLLPARNFFVALYDEVNDVVSFPYFIDEHDPVPAPRRLGAGGLTEVVLRSGEALLVTPERMAAMVKDGQDILGTDSLDWLGVPLRTERRTIGVLTVQSYTGLVRYTDKDKALLQFVSDQVAAAIERKQSVEALHAGEERYRSVIAAMAEGIIVCDNAGRIVDCNASAERMVGESLASMRARGTNPPDWQLVAEDGSPMRYEEIATFDVLATGRAQANAVTGLAKQDGSMVWFSLNAQPLYAESGTALEGVVTTLTDITEKKESEALIWQHANFDALTGMPNRRMFRDRLEQAIKKCKRDNLLLAVLFIDLDRFKEVNDAYGHDKGDILLVEAARRIRGCVRESDTVARLGGDEFTVILSELEATDRVENIAQNIIDRLAAAFPLGDEQVFISASIGITLYPNDATEIDELLRHADQALYVAKGGGRNRFGYFTPALQVAAQARLRLTKDLRQALELGQFSVHFQPMIHLATGEIHKAEALLRWEHPLRGVVSPNEFIPAAEAAGLIIEIGEWVMGEAAKWLKRWRHGVHAELQVSVNQSPLEFQGDRHGNSGWLAQLAALELPGRCLVVEITEGLLLDASTAVNDKLLKLREAGIQVAVDDFGIGYSSLAYLKKFDIDYLKIDQSFVRNLAPGSSDMALSEAIIVMAHKLGLAVIAEGVETAQQRDLLQAAGCDYGQGFLFAPPMPPDDFERFLAHRALARAIPT
jgi:diguanylate cyclase (GGDEF)-like protein/PAS domain S-box-containing protein